MGAGWKMLQLWVLINRKQEEAGLVELKWERGKDGTTIPRVGYWPMVEPAGHF